MNSADEEEVVRSSVQIKDTRGRRLLIVIGFVFVISLLVGYVGGAVSYLSLRGTAKDGAELAQQIQKACKDRDTISPDLEQFCPSADDVVASAPNEVLSSPVPGPPGPQGDPGESGSTGPTGPAPTPSQVLSAVRRYCDETGQCDGRDGKDATIAQVTLAVASYCNLKGQCKGPKGDTGTAGAKGEDGADGEDAPPISQQQVMDAVQSYCNSHNDCRGSDSTVPGPQGEPGVVNVVDNCDAAPNGQVVADVSASYDANSQTVTISCTYKDDQTILQP